MEDLATWLDNLDAVALIEALADNVVVEHVTTGRRIEGKDAVVGWLSDLGARSAEDRIEILRSSVDGSTIWAERMDSHLIDGQWHKIPVMGFIELNADQKVILMRDYFDPALAL